ncbi:hypothetical protein HKBW3S03_00761 [Candidatus Hakubella thermalkaliphila]|uniref:ArnT-like N-terminal domain-containing protein n=4 Tax=Candidatus Hakubella thermalkaliphila TaxID=2754717 RepID=A0A6V8Q109_9ACTN|nr:phospholipid carrier-dependent glycosyltransferase [Candidatus Hakubella thermalkaliphila]GFP19256.1 hypothetical protein HKBW3S03_00761 [Candidatus Hakubella thermalkaliphila]GFP31065.1 hypothetical protein HKBW3S34_01984 [Candidatus Hakubella thermalkaliphila]GFP37784.1 hypothetical protein HKBW3S44_01464 [Candidatus Hakubella thermalkaliphila]GFP38924.1 hypothetical protein HKBW3S47_00624 [Candidatus Hakubella thermalkaliphila]
MHRGAPRRMKIGLFSRERMMKNLKKIFSSYDHKNLDYKFPIFLAIYVTWRLLLLNFNSAEIGDFYNFLLLARDITTGKFPIFTNRLPFYPLLLAIGLPFLDGVLWGRILSLVFSVGILILTYKIAILFSANKNIAFLTVALLTLNPIFAHDSLRALSEAPFVFFVMLTFYLYYRKDVPWRGIFLGTSALLAAMTRFEGYLLIPAVLVGLIVQKRWRDISTVLAIFLVPVIILWGRHQILTGEPPLLIQYLPQILVGPRMFDLLHLYAMHVVFMAGFPLGALWVYMGLKDGLSKQFQQYLPLLVFLALELFLIYKVHPAHRYFNALVPFFSFFLALGLLKEYSLKKIHMPVISVILLSFFIYGSLKFQPFFVVGTIFSAISTTIFTLLVIFIMVLSSKKINFAYFKPLTVFFVVLAGIVLSTSIVLYRQYDYYTVTEASKFVLQKEGRVAWSDETGVSTWYLRERGIGLSEDLNDDEQWVWLKKNSVDYVLVTNEYNEGAELTVVKNVQYRSKFRLVKRFSWNQDQKIALWLKEMGILDEKHMPVVHRDFSEVYEIIG